MYRSLNRTGVVCDERHRWSRCRRAGRERDRHGLSLSELARRAGIAKSTLPQLESGAGNPSVETLWALAVMLNVPFSRLVEPPATPPRVERAGDGPSLRADRRLYTSTLLTACPPGARPDLHVIAAEPRPVRDAAARDDGTIEHHDLTVHSRAVAGRARSRCRGGARLR